MTDATSPRPSKDGRVWTKPKGHWAKGKPRNAWAKGDWPQIRDRTRALIRDHPMPGERSGNALAEVLGVNPTTANEWLRGAVHPPESIRSALLAWIKRQESAIKRRRS